MRATQRVAEVTWTGSGGGERGGGEWRETVFRILSKASSIFQAWLCESGRGRGQRSAPLSAAAVWILNDGGEARRSKQGGEARKAEERFRQVGWRCLHRDRKNLEVSIETVLTSTLSRLSLSKWHYQIFCILFQSTDFSRHSNAENGNLSATTTILFYIQVPNLLYNIINPNKKKIFLKIYFRSVIVYWVSITDRKRALISRRRNKDYKNIFLWTRKECNFIASI